MTVNHLEKPAIHLKYKLEIQKVNQLFLINIIWKQKSIYSAYRNKFLFFIKKI